MLRHGLSPRIESNAVLSKYMQISKEGILVSGEWKICGRHRNSYVDAYHSAVSTELKFSGIISVLCEDYRAVGKWIFILPVWFLYGIFLFVSCTW